MDCSDLDSANNADSTPQNATTVNDFQQNFAQFATNDSGRQAEDSVLLLDVENVADLSETESPMKALPVSCFVNDRWLLPFQNGWGREIVFRQVTEDTRAKKAQCDVYYFAPEGNKLRSIPEVEKYLQSHPLCTLGSDCFTYRRERIYKEPLERVRLAGKTRSRLSSANTSLTSSPHTVINEKRRLDTSADSSSEKRKSLMSIKQRRIELSPPRQKKSYRRNSQSNTPPLLLSPSAVLGLVDGMPIKQEIPSFPLENGLALKDDITGESLSSSGKKAKQIPTLQSLLGRKTDVKRSRGRPRKIVAMPSSDIVDNSTMMNGDFISPPPRVIGTISPTKSNGERHSVGSTGLFGARKVSYSDNEQKNIKIVDVKVPRKPCNLECEGCEGKPLSMQCTLCLCLFHPQCVGVEEHSEQVKSFLCGMCSIKQLKDKALVLPKENENLPPPPPLVSTKSSMTTSTAPRIARPPPLLPAPRVAGYASSHRTPISPHILAPPPLVAGSSSSAVTQPWLLNGVSTQPMQQHDLSTSSATHPIATSASHRSTAASGQMLTLPSTVLKVLDLDKRIMLSVNGSSIEIGSENFKCSGDNVRIYLPPGTLPNSHVASGAGKPLNIHVDRLNPDCQVLTLRDNNTSTTDEVSSVSSSARNAAMLPQDCHFLKLQLGFDCMLEVFKYLSLVDLFRASRVCRIWRKAAVCTSLWRTVRLNGLLVTDWSMAAAVLQDNGTKSLDLRGMLVDERTWSELAAAMGTLTTVLKLELGVCPSDVIHDVCAQMSQLRSLVARSITEADSAGLTNGSSLSIAKVDFSKLKMLRHLQQLKLRGTNGLSMRTFSFGGGFSALASLSKLSILSLTSLRGVEAEQFKFLSSLSDLSVLEIGDVHLWTPDTYAQLLSLPKLRMLRLEGSDNTATTDKGLSAVIATLPCLNHVELVHYAISESLADTLSQASGLRQLCVWPDPGQQPAQTNSRVLKAISRMTLLCHLEWGIRSTGCVTNGDAAAGGSGGEVELMVDGGGEEVSLLPEHVSVKVLQDRVKRQLPHTKVLVFRVPSQARIGY